MFSLDITFMIQGAAELHIIETFLKPQEVLINTTLLGFLDWSCRLKYSRIISFYLIPLIQSMSLIFDFLFRRPNYLVFQLVSAHSNYIMGTKDEVILFYCDTGS
jgi:hypothetical protein